MLSPICRRRGSREGEKTPPPAADLKGDSECFCTVRLAQLWYLQHRELAPRTWKTRVLAPSEIAKEAKSVPKRTATGRLCQTYEVHQLCPKALDFCIFRLKCSLIELEGSFQLFELELFEHSRPALTAELVLQYPHAPVVVTLSGIKIHPEVPIFCARLTVARQFQIKSCHATCIAHQLMAFRRDFLPRPCERGRLSKVASSREYTGRGSQRAYKCSRDFFVLLLWVVGHCTQRMSCISGVTYRRHLRIVVPTGALNCAWHRCCPVYRHLWRNMGVQRQIWWERRRMVRGEELGEH